jgi:hypothetical protein
MCMGPEEGEQSQQENEGFHIQPRSGSSDSETLRNRRARGGEGPGRSREKQTALESLARWGCEGKAVPFPNANCSGPLHTPTRDVHCCGHSLAAGGTLLASAGPESLTKRWLSLNKGVVGGGGGSSAPCRPAVSSLCSQCPILSRRVLVLTSGPMCTLLMPHF